MVSWEGMVVLEAYYQVAFELAFRTTKLKGAEDTMPKLRPSLQYYLKQIKAAQTSRDLFIAWESLTINVEPQTPCEHDYKASNLFASLHRQLLPGPSGKRCSKEALKALPIQPANGQQSIHVNQPIIP